MPVKDAVHARSCARRYLKCKTMRKLMLSALTNATLVIVRKQPIIALFRR